MNVETTTVVPNRLEVAVSRGSSEAVKKQKRQKTPVSTVGDLVRRATTNSGGLPNDVASPKQPIF
jgi:hypothetical protein